MNHDAQPPEHLGIVIRAKGDEWQWWWTGGGMWRDTGWKLDSSAPISGNDIRLAYDDTWAEPEHDGFDETIP